MRYLIIAICFFSILHAELEYEDIERNEEAILGYVVKPKKQNVKTINRVENNRSTTDLENNSFKKDLERQRMLRRAKYLKKKYESALLKFENWEVKKELLKEQFNKKNRAQDTSFGVGNAYGKERAERRRREFYRSLEVQERHIEELVESSRMKLAEIKEEFLFRFAVPLTDVEMNGGPAPKIEDKTKKVEMLNQYINESDAWRRCWEKVAEFEKVNQVANSIEKLFPSNLTQETIKRKMKENQEEMLQHANRYNNIELEFQTKYGLAISSKERAKAILDNINNN